MIIDTHCHIYMNKKQSSKEIIDGLKNDNIKKIISIGTDIDNSLESIKLAKNNPGIIYTSVGIHPTDTIRYKNDIDGNIKRLEDMILENRDYIVGIGECGYDYYRINKDNFLEEEKIQEEFFKKQILLAMKYDLPIIIHNREGKKKTFETLKETGLKKFVMHCFSEDLEFAKNILDFSDQAVISFSGNVTYKSAKNIQETASNIPLGKIVIETDCPFLSPQEVRGTENIPNNTKYTLKKIIELRQENGKNETPLMIEEQIYQNSKKFFSI